MHLYRCTWTFDPESNEQQIRQKSEDEAERRRARILGVDLHVVVAETGDFLGGIIDGEARVELLYCGFGARDSDRLFELADDRAATLNGDLADVIVVEFLAILRIGDSRR